MLVAGMRVCVVLRTRSNGILPVEVFKAAFLCKRDHGQMLLTQSF